MKVQFFLMALLTVALPGCGKIERMNRMVDESTQAIHCNRVAIEHSTAVIRKNIQTIEESNKAIEENRKNLEALNAESQK